MIMTCIYIYICYCIGCAVLYTCAELFGSTSDTTSLFEEQIYCEKCNTITAKSGYSNKICKKCLRGDVKC